MIALKELNPKGYQTTPEQTANLSHLHYALNFVGALYHRPLIVTSGLRSADDQLAIYAKKGISPDKVPMGSMHLRGAAADILDNGKELQQWVLENLHIMESLNLSMESFDSTPNWVHFQIYPPASGSRFFLP